MRVRYIGPCCDADGVEIAATGQTVARGGVVEVDDALGLSLCDQPSNWAPDGDESVDLFVRFCRYVEAVKAAEPAASPRPLVDGAPLPNPGLDALAAPEPAPKSAKSRTTATAEEG